MKNVKSKQLYANSVMNALGYLDDAYCTEAREFEPVSTETTFFNMKRVITAAAVFLLIIGAFLFVPLILGDEPITEKISLFESKETASISVSYVAAKAAGDYDVTFDGVLGLDEFCFRIEGIEGDYSVFAGEKDLRAEADKDGYMTVRLSDYPAGTGSVTVRLSGVEGDLSEARVSTKLPGQIVNASHTLCIS